MATPNNDKKSAKPNEGLSKRNSNRSWKIRMKKEVKNKKFRRSRDVAVILGDSIITDVKGWELTDESNKVVVNVKSFHKI